jgi:hypothetical protein
MKPEIYNLIRQFDEAGAYEFPTDFDYPKLEARALLVKEQLSQLGCKMTFEGAAQNQDASFSIAIQLDDFIQKRNNVLWAPYIRFSNFGSLTTLTWLDLLLDDVIQNVIDCLTRNGFTYIPADELDAHYDGIMQDKNTFPTWWIRYFDWL